MSNNSTNYNAMSNKSKETTYKPTDETLVTKGNVVNNTPSYNVSDSTTVKAADDTEHTETIDTANPEEKVYGVVSNCVKLNVRKKPTKNSEVVTVIESGTEVAIVPSESTEDWYYIALWSGYVMKEFVIIK